MKRLILIAGIFFLVYLVFITVADARSDSVSEISESPYEITEDNGWTIGENEGRVAVFRGGELYMRTDTELASLPKADRTRLENGIEVDSYSELKRLLEDYCS